MSEVVCVLAICEGSDTCRSIRCVFEASGFRLVCVSSPEEALHLLSRGFQAEVLLFEVLKGRSNSQTFSPALMRSVPSERLCILSEPGDTSWAESAAEWGISAVLELPLSDEKVNEKIALMGWRDPLSIGAVSKPRLSSPTFLLEELSQKRFFLAASPAMMQLYRDIRVFASVDLPVLILGESGVGKENVALLLHKYHARADKQLMKVNCAALPNELLESELFGYEAGAFTGATKSKPGLFELSDRGTLLLDEIGEMSPQMQAKLLHVLQDGSFCRLGARATSHVDVRVLAATNIDMDEAIAGKRFREDLYYRLNTLTITVPPLRERREEIPFLMNELFQRGAKELAREEEICPDQLITAAQEYDWPGNLRELRNFVTRTLILRDRNAAFAYLRERTKSKVAGPATKCVPTLPNQTAAPARMKDAVDVIKKELEVRMLQDALTASGWNRRRAASNLDISYRTLLYKIQQHRLTAPV